jgi:hypothetical protein
MSERTSMSQSDYEHFSKMFDSQTTTNYAFIIGMIIAISMSGVALNLAINALRIVYFIQENQEKIQERTSSDTIETTMPKAVSSSPKTAMQLDGLHRFSCRSSLFLLASSASLRSFSRSSCLAFMIYAQYHQ